jgi:hypothetical protein
VSGGKRFSPIGLSLHPRVSILSSEQAKSSDSKCTAERNRIGVDVDEISSGLIPCLRRQLKALF